MRNAAYVWQSATWPDPSISGSNASIYDHSAPDFFSSWYPGDDVVDWIALSVFYRDLSQWNYHPQDHPAKLQSRLLDFARDHQKPVMIAEASPQGFNLSELTRSPIQIHAPESINAIDIWQAWYQPFFSFIYTNRDIIRAVAYINTHWESQPMWFCAEGEKAGSSKCPNGYWGDARIQASMVIKERWLKEVNKPSIWLQESL